MKVKKYTWMRVYVVIYSNVWLTDSPHPQECSVSRGPARARSMAYFGEGEGPIHMDNVKCTGNERSLADCVRQNIGDHNCRHSEDAGVICDYLGKKASGNSSKGMSPSGMCLWRSKNTHPHVIILSSTWVMNSLP